MSIALVCLGWILLLTTPLAVELSVWIGVGGCLWPISLRMALRDSDILVALPVGRDLVLFFVSEDTNEMMNINVITEITSYLTRKRLTGSFLFHKTTSRALARVRQH